jgi:hypothetical protein
MNWSIFLLLHITIIGVLQLSDHGAEALMAPKKGYRFRASFRPDQYGWRKYASEGKGFGEVGALHKGPVSTVPLRFFNELVAGDIAQIVRLPVPPFAMSWFTHNEDGKTHSDGVFSSVDFNYQREEPPKADFDVCAQCLPELCAGILAFDIVVANPDRTRENIWCDNEGSPSALLIFDHDQSLFGGEHDGLERMLAIRDDVGLRYYNQSSNDYHPFLEKVSKRDYLEQWFNRFYSIPKWFIENSCDYAGGVAGVNQADRKKAADFVWHCCRNLEQIVLANKKLFSGITGWGAEPGGLF